MCSLWTFMCRGLNCWFCNPHESKSEPWCVLVYSACSDWGVLHLCFFLHTATKCPAHWSAWVCKQQAPLPQSVSYEKNVRGGTCGDGCPMELATILCHIVHQFGQHHQKPHLHKHKIISHTNTHKQTWYSNTYSQSQITPTPFVSNMQAVSHATLICCFCSPFLAWSSASFCGRMVSRLV